MNCVTPRSAEESRRELAGRRLGDVGVTGNTSRHETVDPSPIVVGDQYYTLMDRGIVTATDPSTGREIYGRQRIAPDTGTFSASPWSYRGKIFAITRTARHS